MSLRIYLPIVRRSYLSSAVDHPVEMMDVDYAGLESPFVEWWWRVALWCSIRERQERK